MKKQNSFAVSFHGPPHRAFVNALGQCRLRIALAENDAGICTAALGLGQGQAVRRVPQTEALLLKLQKLKRTAGKYADMTKEKYPIAVWVESTFREFQGILMGNK